MTEPHGGGLAFLCCLCVMLGAGTALFVAHVMRDGSVAIVADRYQEKIHHDRCIAARTVFFEDCYQWGRGRYECEALWAQKQSHVFDGSPTHEWVDEINCSSEVK